MAGKSTSIAEPPLVFVLLVFWRWFISWLVYWCFVVGLASPAPAKLWALGSVAPRALTRQLRQGRRARICPVLGRDPTGPPYFITGPVREAR